MSISNSLSNALSGLTAASRAAEVVSANVANVTTEGYGRRVLETSSATVGGQGAGVGVVGVRREVDQYILADRRNADAGSAAADVTAQFYTDLQAAVGLPDAANSVTGRLSTLESSLVEAVSRPDNDARLNAVVDAANALADTLNDASNDIQTARTEADQQIAAQVDLLNKNLTQIADLNGQIRLQVAAGHDGAALMDQRQVLVDQVAEIIPVRVVQQDYGQIAIFTTNGATLLSGVPSEFGFTPTGTIVPEMTIEAGALGGLTLNGQPISTSGPTSQVAGGSLNALFEVRDVLAVEAQAELDAVARDLIERFEDPALDATRAPGDPGLFTDAGAAFDPADEPGLAGRLSVNAIVDPSQGGAVWHIRSGLGATAPGPAGDAALINDLADALTQSRVPASGRFAGAARSAADLAAEFTSYVGQTLDGARAEQGFAAAKADAMRLAELEGGVDTDHEMQMLLLIEQAFSANARVVQTLDDLINTLLRI